LADGNRFEDSITIPEQEPDSKAQQGQYKYYKFYKACADQCDLEITIEPQQSYLILYAVIDVDSGSGKLPTMSGGSPPRWSRQIFKTQEIIIQADDR
jgi:hypothetical protein